jgi:hypothetical protein
MAKKNAGACVSSFTGKATMRIHVTVYDKTFAVACGAGNQSIKWLSLVAASRYAAATGCHIGQWIPEGVGTVDGTVRLYNPQNDICDELEDEQTVHVELKGASNSVCTFTCSSGPFWPSDTSLTRSPRRRAPSFNVAFDRSYSAKTAQGVRPVDDHGVF